MRAPAAFASGLNRQVERGREASAKGRSTEPARAHLLHQRGEGHPGETVEGARSSPQPLPPEPERGANRQLTPAAAAIAPTLVAGSMGSLWWRVLWAASGGGF